ncbi:dTMP kinase [Pancytospora philotis]|nr:dTMP kinase [Pancytospora philotis]
MAVHKFIVLEGLDRSGKSTVCSMLAARLQRCKCFAFPDRSSSTGVLIDNFLKQGNKAVPSMCPAVLHLLYSANRYEKAEAIHNALQHGHVVCDRYWYSGAAYSAAKGLDYEWCKQADSHLPVPNRVFFIDADAETVAKRSGFGEEAHDQIDLQKRVYDTYRRMVGEGLMEAVDGRRSIDEIFADILSRLNL